MKRWTGSITSLSRAYSLTHGILLHSGIRTPRHCIVCTHKLLVPFFWYFYAVAQSLGSRLGCNVGSLPFCTSLFSLFAVRGSISLMCDSPMLKIYRTSTARVSYFSSLYRRGMNSSSQMHETDLNLVVSAARGFVVTCTSSIVF